MNRTPGRMVRAFCNRKGKPYRLFWIMPPGATASPATSYPVRNFPTTTPAVKPYGNLARISLSERKFEEGLSSVHIVAALALESDGCSGEAAGEYRSYLQEDPNRRDANGAKDKLAALSAERQK
jgi:hypothetical protein